MSEITRKRWFELGCWAASLEVDYGIARELVFVQLADEARAFVESGNWQRWLEVARPAAARAVVEQGL